MITIEALNHDKVNFEIWLASMSDVLNNVKLFPKEIREKLDYTVESLDVIEFYILKNYAFEDSEDSNYKVAFDLFSRYVGETFIKNLNDVIWEFQNYDSKNIYFGKAILNKKEGMAFTPDYPYSYCVALLNRKKGNYLSSILNFMISKYNI
jgi:hypothetical protein